MQRWVHTDRDRFREVAAAARPLAPEFRSSAGSPSTTPSRPTGAPATARAGSSTRPPAASPAGGTSASTRSSGSPSPGTRWSRRRVAGRAATTDARVPLSRRWRGLSTARRSHAATATCRTLRRVRLALVRRRPRAGVVSGVGARGPRRGRRSRPPAAPDRRLRPRGGVGVSGFRGWR